MKPSILFGRFHGLGELARLGVGGRQNAQRHRTLAPRGLAQPCGQGDRLGAVSDLVVRTSRPQRGQRLVGAGVDDHNLQRRAGLNPRPLQLPCTVLLIFHQ